MLKLCTLFIWYWDFNLINQLLPILVLMEVAPPRIPNLYSFLGCFGAMLYFTQDVALLY
jgi:hypothetical protein